MTSIQKEQIDALRAQGLGYMSIAKRLCLTVSAVKGYCQRQQKAATASGKKERSEDKKPSNFTCPACGRTILQRTGIKKRRFCSDACRQAWWNSHPEMVHRKAIYQYTCPTCGKPFSAYGDAHRKYCSRACYITDRYQRGEAHG